MKALLLSDDRVRNFWKTTSPALVGYTISDLEYTITVYIHYNGVHGDHPHQLIASVCYSGSRVRHSCFKCGAFCEIYGSQKNAQKLIFARRISACRRYCKKQHSYHGDWRIRAISTKREISRVISSISRHPGYAIRHSTDLLFGKCSRLTNYPSSKRYILIKNMPYFMWKYTVFYPKSHLRTMAIGVSGLSFSNGRIFEWRFAKKQRCPDTPITMVRRYIFAKVGL